MTADKTTPERIWIKPCDPCDRADDYYLCSPEYLDGRETTYVRADLADAQAQENARLRQIIAQMDALTPRANKTCDQPGITLSEAIQREWPHLRVRTGETL